MSGTTDWTEGERFRYHPGSRYVSVPRVYEVHSGSPPESFRLRPSSFKRLTGEFTGLGCRVPERERDRPGLKNFNGSWYSDEGKAFGLFGGCWYEDGSTCSLQYDLGFLVPPGFNLLETLWAPRQCQE